MSGKARALGQNSFNEEVNLPISRVCFHLYKSCQQVCWKTIRRQGKENDAFVILILKFDDQSNSLEERVIEVNRCIRQAELSAQILHACRGHDRDVAFLRE